MINDLSGELERTMLNSFCRAGAVKAFLGSTGCPETLKGLSGLVDDFLNRNRNKDSPSAIQDNLMTNCNIPANFNWAASEKISTVIREALEKVYGHLCQLIQGWATPSKIIRHQHITIDGVAYTDFRTPRGHPVIFFQPLGTEHLVPGIVQAIISVPLGTTASSRRVQFLLAKRYLPVDDNENPFLSFPHFGASLWRLELADELDVVPICSRVAHGIHMKWTEKTFVLKAVHGRW